MNAPMADATISRLPDAAPDVRVARARDAADPLLSDTAFTRLKALLLDGGLKAGEPASQQELAARLGFPIAPMREAIKRASVEGLLRVVPQRGIWVTQATPERIRDGFGFRLLVDREGARKLARRGWSDALQALHDDHLRVIDRCRRLLDDDAMRASLDINWRLHAFLAGAVRNAIVDEAYARNRDQLTIMQLSRPQPPDRVVPALEEHVAILEAIRRGDAEGADAATAAHARQSLRWWGILDTAYE